MRDELLCRKINHPWRLLAQADIPGDVFAGTSLVVVGFVCPQCTSERFDEYRRNGRLNRRAYRYPQSYKDLGEELRDTQRSGETRGQAVTRRFLVERGLVREPSRSKGNR